MMFFRRLCNTACFLDSFSSATSAVSSDQQLQCWACGLPKLHPENDIVGSYGTAEGKKMYNNTCTELEDTIKDGKVDKRFLRTCPQGVKSCFGAYGFYDHNDNDPSNDIRECLIQFEP